MRVYIGRSYMNHKLSAETKLKISLALKGKPRKGHPHTEESKRKIGDSSKKWLSEHPEWREQQRQRMLHNNPNNIPGVREKISMSHISSSAGHGSVHEWLTRNFGKPDHCGICDSAEPNKKYEWTNITGDGHTKQYTRNIEDYIWTCTSCHGIFDRIWLNFGKGNLGRKFTPEHREKIRQARLSYWRQKNRLSGARV